MEPRRQPSVYAEARYQLGQTELERSEACEEPTELQQLHHQCKNHKRHIPRYFSGIYIGLRRSRRLWTLGRFDWHRQRCRTALRRAVRRARARTAATGGRKRAPRTGRRRRGRRRAAGRALRPTRAAPTPRSQAPS
ncbi:hypothetical protein ON010_g3385 [Phytophthora cinnamomi]|nr:hypothetical protein ON010_g3385 [Phytophthora cinnamomi]